MRKCGAQDECCCDAMRRKSSTLGDSGRNASAVTEDDGFVPRRSTHVTGPTNADGDTWQESLAGRDNADAFFLVLSPFLHDLTL